MFITEFPFLSHGNSTDILFSLLFVYNKVLHKDFAKDNDFFVCSLSFL